MIMKLCISSGFSLLCGEQLRQAVLDEGRDAAEVVRAHARGEQRLVSVAHGRVHQQQLLVIADGARETLRTLFLKHVAPAVRSLLC